MKRLVQVPPQEVHINRHGCEGRMSNTAKEAIAEAAQKLASAFSKNQEKCAWCGKTLNEHADVLGPAVPRMPCKGLKAHFCAPAKPEVETMSKPSTEAVIIGFPMVSDNCAGCGKPLLIENSWITDGCPCNSGLGVNSMNETRWRLLMQFQQDQSRKLEALSKFKAYVHKRLDDAGIPVDPESPHRAEGCRIGGRLDIVLALASAMPDLLEACIKQAALMEGLRNLLTAYRVGRQPTEKTLDAVQGASEVQDLARAAIARATGGPA